MFDINAYKMITNGNNIAKINGITNDYFFQ